MLKIRNLLLVFLGTIFPDISHIGIVILMKLFHFTETQAFTYFFPFHTPLFLLVIALAVAYSTKKFKESFIILCVVLSLHLFIDSLQKGNMIFPFYPFNLTPYSLNLFWQESAIVYSLQVFSFVLLVYALLKERIQFNAFYIKRLVIFGLIIIILPFFTRNIILNNFYYYQFLNHPENWEGENITLSNRIVVSENPASIKLGESRNIDRNIEIITSEKIKAGDIVALDGLYENGKIIVADIHVQNVFLKEVMSGAGLLMLVLILLKSWVNHIRIKGLLKW